MNKLRQRQLKRTAREHLSPPEIERLIKQKQHRRKYSLPQKLKLRFSQAQIEKLRVWRLIWKNQPDVKLEPELSLKQKVKQARLERVSAGADQ